MLSYNNLQELNESILARTDNIIIPISEDLELNEEYHKQIFNKYNHKTQLQNEHPSVGRIINIKEDKITIFYVIHKQFHWEKSNYEFMYTCLLNLLNILIKENIKSIRLPRLGAGFGQLRWNKIRTMLRFIFHGSSINLFVCHDILIAPKDDEINDILIENHNNPSSGHFGYHKTLHRIKQHYKWSTMKSDVKNFIKHCTSCQANKLVRKKNKKPMEITTTSTKPFERIALDIVGPLPLTEDGNKYILTLQDDLTKFTQAYAVHNHEAETIANVFVTKFICNYGTPLSILTDQGRDFTSNLFKNVAKLFKIKSINTTAYHPESNGALERSHHTIAD